MKIAVNDRHLFFQDIHTFRNWIIYKHFFFIRMQLPENSILVELKLFFEGEEFLLPGKCQVLDQMALPDPQYK